MIKHEYVNGWIIFPLIITSFISTASKIESLKLKLGCHKKPQDETNKSCADVFLDNFSNIEDMAQLRNRVLNEIDDFTQQLQLRCLRCIVV